MGVVFMHQALGIILFSVAFCKVYAAVPYTFSAGAPISASQMNSNFSTLVSSQWTTSSSSQIYYPGNVAIGTSSSAGMALNVNGYLGATMPWTMSAVPATAAASGFTARGIWNYGAMAVSITVTGVYLISYNVRISNNNGPGDTQYMAGIAVTTSPPSAGTMPSYLTLGEFNSAGFGGGMVQLGISGLTLQYLSAGQLVTAGIYVGGGSSANLYYLDGNSGGGMSSLVVVRIGNNSTPP